MKLFVFFSDLTETEIENALEGVKDLFLNLPKENMEYVEVTSEIFQLANEYVNEKVVGKTSFDEKKT